MYFNSVISDTLPAVTPSWCSPSPLQRASAASLRSRITAAIRWTSTQASSLGPAPSLPGEGQIGRPEGRPAPLAEGMLPFSPLGATGRLSRAQTCQMCKVTRSQNLSCGEKVDFPLSPQGMSVAWWGPWSQPGLTSLHLISRPAMQWSSFQAPPAETSGPSANWDALRALTQRGHDSVCQQNKSVSTDELGPPSRLEKYRPVTRQDLTGQPKAGQCGCGPACSSQPHGQGEHGDLQPHTALCALAERPPPPHDHPRSTGWLPAPSSSLVNGSRSRWRAEAWGYQMRVALHTCGHPAEPMAEEEEEEEEEGGGGGGRGPAPSLYPTVQARPGLGPCHPAASGRTATSWFTSLRSRGPRQQLACPPIAVQLYGPSGS